MEDVKYYSAGGFVFNLIQSPGRDKSINHTTTTASCCNSCFAHGFSESCLHLSGVSARVLFFGAVGERGRGRQREKKQGTLPAGQAGN